MAQWARRYLCRPHAQLGRPGPVCPYMRQALRRRAVEFAVWPGRPDGTREVVRRMLAYGQWFAAAPHDPYRALIVAMPAVGGGDLAWAIERPQRRLKTGFAERGLMIGEFHPGPPPTPGLWNPRFRPMHSPVPLLAIRHMVGSDLPFLRDDPRQLADLISAGLNTQGMMWSTCPAATELEHTVCDWLGRLMAMPEPLRRNGIIQDTASSGALVAMTAALCRHAGDGWRRDGTDARCTMYTSTEGNVAIGKAARIAGIGETRLRRIAVDPATYAMDPAALRAAVRADLAAGRRPVAVVATIGTTSTTAVDPLRHIGETCREYGLWLHVDAAYAGVAAICPELRWIHDGVEYADSYCVNPHKWLLTGFDCDVMWFADPGAVTTAMSGTPPYLRVPGGAAQTAAIDYRDWQIPLGRRFRALKLWFVLRHYGRRGLAAHLRSGIAMAQRFAEWVRADSRFEVVAPHPFGLVCFRLRDSDRANRELLRRVNGYGDVFLSSTEAGGRFVLRMAAGGTGTTPDHLSLAWQRITAAIPGS